MDGVGLFARLLLLPLALILRLSPVGEASAAAAGAKDDGQQCTVDLEGSCIKDGMMDAQMPPGLLIKVNKTNHLFHDTLGRTRIFHGMNAVMKKEPYYPIYDKFHNEESLCEEDAINLKNWGFNVVRLGVMWVGVEPSTRGVYDMEYLDHINNIIALLAKHGIYTIVDFHQDLLARKFCGEGVPTWVEDLFLKAQAEDTKGFPWPAGGTYEYDEDEEGPSWAKCQSASFLKYYLSAQVSAAFQSLYDNAEGLLDAFTDFWVVVANRFAGNPWVLGYEIMNEPWAGDVVNRPRLLAQPGLAEKVNLQPMYTKLNKAIREVDNESLLFYEGFAWAYWPQGFTETPGGEEYEDRDVLSYHIYCPLADTGVASRVCDPMNREYYYMRFTDVERLGGGSFLTEFGAVPNSTDHMRQMEQIMSLADEYYTSWAYWSFKDYHDVTTINGGQQAMYEGGQEPVHQKLAVLSRTYAQIVAGVPLKMHFDATSKDFVLEFMPRSDESETPFHPLPSPPQTDSIPGAEKYAAAAAGGITAAEAAATAAQAAAAGGGGGGGSASGAWAGGGAGATANADTVTDDSSSSSSHSNSMPNSNSRQVTDDGSRARGVFSYLWPRSKRQPQEHAPFTGAQRTAHTSVIYLNYDIHYPYGFNVEIEPPNAAYLPENGENCGDSNYLEVILADSGRRSRSWFHRNQKIHRTKYPTQHQQQQQQQQQQQVGVGGFFSRVANAEFDMFEGLKSVLGLGVDRLEDGAVRVRLSPCPQEEEEGEEGGGEWRRGLSVSESGQEAQIRGLEHFCLM